MTSWNGELNILENIFQREISFFFSSNVGLFPTCEICFCPKTYTNKPNNIAIPANPKPACHPHLATTSPITDVANNDPRLIPI